MYSLELNLSLCTTITIRWLLSPSSAPTLSPVLSSWMTCKHSLDLITGRCWACLKTHHTSLTHLDMRFGSGHSSLNLDSSNCLPSRLLIHVDNKGSVDLALNPVHHKRTKHINIKHHFIQQCLEDFSVELVQICWKGDFTQRTWTQCWGNLENSE